MKPSLAHPTGLSFCFFPDFLAIYILLFYTGELDNGTWDGLLGEVIDGDKNFTINYFTITQERLDYFDSSVSYFREGFGFALKNPAPYPPWTSLIYPFSWQVYMTIYRYICASYSSVSNL